ncbi:MAG TPA: cell division FtsA domain-containing protein [Bacillota bacterium]|nr:cell division FtsA domain-containing protein [Bacillota bacterium]
MTQQVTNDLIFALDIGTRSVVGLIVRFDGDTFSIIDYEIAEHKERSMLDGQIHDIEAVSLVVETIKNKLSIRNGVLKKVAVAAAGRSLKTKRVTLEQPLAGHSFLTKDEVRSLELSAIGQAQKELATEQSEIDLSNYFCVGYSIVNYYLDGQLISNLVDQRGSMAQVDIIATFLPRIVVDSLITALHHAELSLDMLTLEPIAAINVLIPSTMRKLNIALVDIGAGTSDIAITAEGTIIAYGMVPRAGDEITEALGQAFLLDFSDAEIMKRSLSHKDQVTFADVLGMEHTLPSTEVVMQIDEDIQKLALEISNKILELNGKAPQAVMLIGGGSLTPQLPMKIAQILNLPDTRVAVRGTDAIKNLEIQHEIVSGPEFITPIGIAVAAKKHPVKYITVSVNEREIHLFDLKKIHVGDVLLHAGFDMKKLCGKPGLAMAIKVNGIMKFIPGTWGEPPIITLNDKIAHYDDLVHDQDHLTVIPGKDGSPACPTIQDVMENIATLDIFLNGRLYSVPPLFLVNGIECDLNTLLHDRDEVWIRLPRNIQEVLQYTEQLDLVEVEELSYTLNGQVQRWERYSIEFKLNGQLALPTSLINQGDHIEIHYHEKSNLMISSLIPEGERIQLDTEVTFNGLKIRLPIIRTKITLNGDIISEDNPIHPGDKIMIETIETTPPIFGDVFRIAEVRIKKPDPGSRLKLLINSEPADFGSKIKHGDRLELLWEPEEEFSISDPEHLEVRHLKN